MNRGPTFLLSVVFLLTEIQIAYKKSNKNHSVRYQSQRKMPDVCTNGEAVLFASKLLYMISLWHSHSYFMDTTVCCVSQELCRPIGCLLSSQMFERFDCSHSEQTQSSPNIRSVSRMRQFTSFMFCWTARLPSGHFSDTLDFAAPGGNVSNRLHEWLDSSVSIRFLVIWWVNRSPCGSLSND